MEADVFGYFLAIGAGLSFGLSLGAAPAIIVWRLIKNRGGMTFDRKIKKARS